VEVKRIAVNGTTVVKLKRFKEALKKAGIKKPTYDDCINLLFSYFLEPVDCKGSFWELLESKKQLTQRMVGEQVEPLSPTDVARNFFYVPEKLLRSFGEGNPLGDFLSSLKLGTSLRNKILFVVKDKEIERKAKELFQVLPDKEIEKLESKFHSFLRGELLKLRKKYGEVR